MWVFSPSLSCPRLIEVECSCVGSEFQTTGLRWLAENTLVTSKFCFDSYKVSAIFRGVAVAHFQQLYFLLASGWQLWHIEQVWRRPVFLFFFIWHYKIAQNSTAIVHGHSTSSDIKIVKKSCKIITSTETYSTGDTQLHKNIKYNILIYLPFIILWVR